MGKLYAQIDENLAAWIEAQPMFFVGTTPLASDAHVNVSPKGLDTLRILGPRRVAYLDLTGSGAETIAHLRENGRIVLMFCAFAGPPKIVRLHGTGRVITPESEAWTALVTRYPVFEGGRTIIDIDVERISDACGYGVPTFENPNQREALPRWAHTRGAEGLARYRQQKNTTSIDGLPALDPEPECGTEQDSC